MRLLPWRTVDGKPCYLHTDQEGGYISRLADEMEVVQLTIGAEILGHAREVLADRNASAQEPRYTAAQLGDCLSDALRVAESRGMRLPEPTQPDGGEDAPNDGTATPTEADG